MAPGNIKFSRPDDSQYWCEAWSSVPFAGDVFEAIPFATPPTKTYVAEGFDEAQHVIGDVAWGFGMLLTPTCDMYESLNPELLAHPFRVLAPVLPLAGVVEQTSAVEKNLGLLRKRDQLHTYMYLPPLQGVFPESVVALYRPTVVTENFLSDPPRRVAQMKPEARRHLKVKLARYWGRAAVAHEDLPLHERDEDEARSAEDPPSRYDPE